VSLRHTFARAASPIDRDDALGDVLGGAAIGDGSPLPPVTWPRQRLRMPVLLPSSAASLHETWHGRGPVQQGHSQGIHWRRNADVLYGVIECEEAGQTPAEEGVTPLQSAARSVYERLFGLLRQQQMPHLWRVWNYLAHINQASHGLERYRQFNLGRYTAFEQAHRDTGGQVPAACAIGVRHGPLTVAFLAGHAPVVPVENPRQLSAWRYPSQYGPRAPTFSRAALAHPPGQEALFISGTASIVGHETVHEGDVAAQCVETVRNLACVVQEANRLARSPVPFSLAGMSHRAYVRHAGDAATVERTLQPLLGGAPLVCVQADICRSDLLVEVESQAIHALPSP
jgi:chorismate lyase/3-hydroxybenzoate synthase